jgi:MFS family permease
MFGIFYGWIIVGIFFVNMAMAFGIWYSFSVFFVALVAEFNWSRAAAAGAFSIFMLTHYGMAGILGSVMERFGPRILIPTGAMIAVIGLVAASRIETLWQLYLFYGVVTAVGVCSMGILSCGIFLPNWFQRKRGLAMGFATAGIGVGMLILVPAIQHIISNYGWRTGYCALGAIVFFAVIPLNLLFQRKNPQEVGTVPDGVQTAHSSVNATGEKIGSKGSGLNRTEGLRVRNVLGIKQFWFLFFSNFCVTFAIQGTLVHQVAYAVDKGLSAETGAFFFALAGIVGSVGKIGFGYLSDRIGKEKALSVGIACACVGIVCLLGLRKGWMNLLYGYAIAFGLGYGAVAPIFPTRAADLFMGPGFGRIYGLLSLGPGLGGAGGTWLLGRIFDLTSSYRIAFFIVLSALSLSLFLFWLSSPQSLKAQQKDSKRKRGSRS